MEHLVKRAFLMAVVCFGFATAAPQSRDFSELFQQLQTPATTNQAAQQLLSLAQQSTDAREFLVEHLPGWVANGPAEPSEPWLNGVKLVGELKIAEAAPVLEKWIALETGGTITLSMMAKLENKPVGKALAKIGDPAIPTLSKALQHPAVEDREVAAMALRLIGTPRAKEALQTRLEHEPDAHLRGYIKNALDHWKPTS